MHTEFCIETLSQETFCLMHKGNRILRISVSRDWSKRRARSPARLKCWARPATWHQNKRLVIMQSLQAQQMCTDLGPSSTNCSPAIHRLLEEQRLKPCDWFWTPSLARRAC